MASLSNVPFSGYWKRLFQIGQTTNTGVDTTTRNILTGDGSKTSISLSDDQLLIQPQVDNTTSTLDVKNQAGNSVLTVDTSNSKILAGVTQVSVNTHYKEFGMYQLDVAQGSHHPLICNNMLIGNDSNESWEADDSTLGSGANPATTLDLSADGTGANLAACLWYVEDNITIDTCRFIASCKNASARNLNFHLLSYTLDVSTNYGDLSAGAVVSDGTVSVSQTQVKVGTLSNVGDVNIDATKVVICTVENVDSTDEVTCQIVVKYHIR
jgi:hypothetical protein